MQAAKFITGILGTVALVLVCGCSNLISSAVESGVVYIVAKHDETVEKKQKRYTATHRCVVKGKPDAVTTGDAIAYGQQITAQYNIILSRTGENIEPAQPHKLAYALYIIADEIHDNRAKARIEWLKKQIPPEDEAEVRSIIADKFLASHLEKCFSVPSAYKIQKTTRQLIQEEQQELNRRNAR